MQNKNNQFEGLKLKNVLSIIAAVTGALCFLFLLTGGISYSQGYYPSTFNMGQMIFGTDWAGINPGLLSAFIIMCLAIVCALGMNFKDIFGYLSIVLFITSAVLWFCTVALYNNWSATLSVAGWCLGVFNIVDAALVFVGISYR